MSDFSKLSPDLDKDLRIGQNFSKLVSKNLVLPYLVKILKLPLVGDLSQDVQTVMNSGDKVLLDWFLSRFSKFYTRGISNNTFRNHRKYIFRHYNGDANESLILAYMKYKRAKALERRKEKAGQGQSKKGKTICSRTKKSRPASDKKGK